MVLAKFEYSELISDFRYFPTLALKKQVFDKGYTPNWTEEIFVVDGVLNTKPVTCKIVDLMGEPIEDSFYEQELQKAKQETYKMRKSWNEIMKKTALVKWRGYPDKFINNSWIPLSDLVDF